MEWLRTSVMWPSSDEFLIFLNGKIHVARSSDIDFEYITGGWTCCCYCGGENRSTSDKTGEKRDILYFEYWMPLPEPPEQN